ncbi:hypothetical protein Cfor_06872 [Coptotermes formosanus]|uniref:Phospholipase A2 n=1 Tax=Coptotermes formosanus TaxID=36987 RepID=A0A6L2PLX7_COPFO|nr:hypothetical protein Cfor_06872 [Coptotermes formosanus]
MSILDRRLVAIPAVDAVTEMPTMSRAREMRTIPSGGAFLSLSVVGLALLVIGPVLIKAQSSPRTQSPYKGFSGLWVKSDSVKQVYYHDQTVAVVELGPGKILQNCELVEVTTPKEVNKTLRSLLSLSAPMDISFEEMLQLMNQCHDFVSPLETSEKSSKSPRVAETVLFGIVPGTKWCGNSDIAKTYFDLGREKEVDKCCRTHDLCPVKVQPYRTRYNLTNEHFYTKSHCACDNKLFQCLKDKNTPLSRLIGNVYFNIIKVPCVDDIPPACDESGCVTKKFRKARPFP